MSVNVGDRLGGKYRIVRRIGAGGMGTVYEATHEGLGTRVAVKVLLPQLCQAPTIADRFQREARVSAQLQSPHVIQVTDVDRTDAEVPYLVMELLEGESLQQRLDTAGRLAPPEAVEIARQVLVGLECAHSAGVVHRDLKPDNAYLTGPKGDQVVKLLDFGIAKVKASREYQALTRPGTAMGTPEYMAPEQAFSAAEVDARSDLYSVGVMLYEMLSGQLPAEGATPQRIAQQVISGAVPPLQRLCPELPEPLCELVQRAMRPSPLDRPESASSMRAEILQISIELSRAPVVIPAATEQMSQFHLPGVARPAPAAADEAPAPVEPSAPAPTKPPAPLPTTPPSTTPPKSTRDTAPLADGETQRGASAWPWAAALALLASVAIVSWVLLNRVEPGPPPPRPVPQTFGR